MMRKAMNVWGRSGWGVLLIVVMWLMGMAPVQAAPPNKKPNVEVSLSDHLWMTDEQVSASVSFYNLPGAKLFVHRIGLGQLAQTPQDIEHLAPRLMALKVTKETIVRKFAAYAGKSYADNWTYQTVKVPVNAPGVYLLRAVAGGLEKRTWFAITNTGLLLKRARGELLVYATRGNAGAPLGGLPLSMRAGNFTAQGVTDGTGVLRVKVPDDVNIWVSGTKNGEPAFAISGSPSDPEPYTIYTQTDRPIYRPGSKVGWKGVVRRRVEAPNVPGGFRYETYARGPVEVELRDPTDALISRLHLTTDEFGSFASELQLAGEPALGDWQIVTKIGDFHTYAGFVVQAYRKPEYTAQVQFDQPHYLGGDVVPVTIRANYFWGQPVVDANVKYNIEFEGDDSEPPYNAEGQTDAKGELHLQIRTQRRKSDRTLNVSATVTDLSRRSQSAEGSTLIAAALFRLSLETDKQVYRPGEKAIVKARVTDYDDKPVATTVYVTLSETLLDSKKKYYTVQTKRTIQTQANGVGTAQFALPRPGYLSLSATAKDVQSNVVSANDYIWVSGGDAEGYNYPELEALPDKSAYKPGDTAQILIQTNTVDKDHPVAWALVTLEGERLGAQQVVKLTGRSTPVRIPLTAASFPSVQLNIAIVQDGELTEKELRLQVERDEEKLKVEVRPDKAQYLPGETATYTVTTHDSAGRPARAQVALGVVDASIYAVRADSTPDINSFFWHDQTVRVQTDWSFARQYSGGGMQTIPKEGEAPTDTPRVRRKFLDTAYWNPFVITGSDGTARVSFEMPDNLTTWRATARGITNSTQAGQTTSEALVSMPLQVRLELPRFYVEDDKGTVSVIVHNYTKETRPVTVNAEATGATLDGGAKTAQLAPGGQARLEWVATIGKPSGTKAPTVRFASSALAGGVSDAMELTLPVLPRGLKMTKAESFALDTNQAHPIDLSKLPPDATLTLQLQPSLAASLLDAVGELQSYPYGCSEQTMSALLPDVVVSRTLKKLGYPQKANKDLSQMVSLGLQKLYRYQHSDGGWNLWENDQTDPEMTAYVLWGLLQARDAGYLVDETRIARGASALNRFASSPSADIAQVADWLEPLALVQPDTVGKLAPIVWKQREKLDAHGLASLVLACQSAAPKAKTGPALRLIAQSAAQELERKAVRVGTLAHWTGEEGGYSWRDDDTEVSAHALRAILEAKPDSSVIQPAVRWLMSQRDGGPSGRGAWWGTTKATAETVYALSRYLERTDELNADYTAEVQLGSKNVRTLHVTRDNVFKVNDTITLRPEDWKGAQTLNVSRQGRGTLYVTVRQNYLLPADQATPRDDGIAVRRTFKLETEDPSQANGLASGARMTVTVELTAKDNYRWALLEDPIPAGCEVGSDANGTDDNGYYNQPYQRREVRDDRVAFFFDTLPKGRTTVSYTLVCESPGQYTILPSIASLFYFPEVRGNSGLVGAMVRDEEPKVEPKNAAG